MPRSKKHLFAGPASLVAILFLAAFSGSAGLAAPQDNQNSKSQPASQSSAQKNPGQTASHPSAAGNGVAGAHKTFSSAQDAAAALYSAARSHDESAMVVILGPSSRELVEWIDDPTMRSSDIDLFVQKYDQMHRLVHEPDDETTLYVGAENWPLPIPIVEKNGGWYFDSAMGKREITFRRIGENEMDATESLHALVDAENDYYTQTADSSGMREYAARFSSSDGKHDGLYWPQGSNSANSEECPLGPYMAQASYDHPNRKPLHGYYFRLLTEQGPKARGGARSYIADGKLTEGFAFVAFPAEYRSSGIETFVVNDSGVVYEKDLGPMTAQIAASMKAYNPDSTWVRVRRPLGVF